MAAEPEPPSTQRLGKVMTVAAWLLVLAGLTLFFRDWLEDQRNPNQAPSAQQLADGSREVVLERNRYGHYVATGRINGQPVELIVDTGASDVAIPAGVAERLALEKGAPRRYRTANGLVTGYRTELEEVKLGPIAVANVQASIQPGMDTGVLLGMSFLKHLDFNQQDDTLILRQRP